MNSTDEIDNEDVFHLDTMNTSEAADGLQVFSSRHNYPHPTPIQVQDPQYNMSEIEDLATYRHNALDLDVKGKGVSQPMLIRRSTNPTNQHDSFALSLESGFSSGASLPLDSSLPILSPSSFASSSADVFSIQTPNSPLDRGSVFIHDSAPFHDRSNIQDQPELPTDEKGKGKATEYTSSTPPVLPPLSNFRPHYPREKSGRHSCEPQRRGHPPTLPPSRFRMEAPRTYRPLTLAPRRPALR